MSAGGAAGGGVCAQAAAAIINDPPANAAATKVLNISSPQNRLGLNGTSIAAAVSAAKPRPARVTGSVVWARARRQAGAGAAGSRIWGPAHQLHVRAAGAVRDEEAVAPAVERREHLAIGADQRHAVRGRLPAG